METIAHNLYGSYAYLLIFQIVLVAALSITLLVMLVKRIKASLTMLTDVALPSSVVPDTGAMQRLEQEKAELLTKIHSLESMLSEAEVPASVAEEKRTLFEKVKYLESKLLEYEILQEEIGSITALKAENQKLVQQLVQQLIQQQQVHPLEEPPAPSSLPSIATGEQSKVLAKEAKATTKQARQAEVDSLLNEINNITKP